jgi:hypothetical protein
MIIYLIGALAIGFLFGIVVELIFEAKQLTELQRDYRKLELENEMLRKEVPTERVIEIIDNTVGKDIEFGGF